MQSENRVTSIQAISSVGFHEPVVDRDNAGIADLFAGADVGLALFDPQLCLLACNDLYKTLCGYISSDLPTGIRLQQLMRITFSRLNVAVTRLTRRSPRLLTVWNRARPTRSAILHPVAALSRYGVGGCPMVVQLKPPVKLTHPPLALISIRNMK